MSIALVGRPNVGKSRLFNRLLGRRVSIVHDMPGVTRDIVMEKMKCGAMLMDTGGIGATPEMTQKVIADATNEQADFAIAAASLIIFVVDSQSGLMPLDEKIADKIRKSGAKAILAVNKSDVPEHDERVSDFYKLGFEHVCAISAEHGRGMEDLWNAVEYELGPLNDLEETEEAEPRIKISVAGRPNVGKSSIGNKLLGSKRLIVSEIAGTTRDPVKCDIDFTNDRGDLMRFEFFDTAGVRAKRKVNTSLDYFSTLRTKGAIANSDIVMLVIDAREGVSESDQKLAGEILESGAAVMLVVNKWDYATRAFREDKIEGGYENVVQFRNAFEEAVRAKLFFLHDSPIYFVSAKEDKGLEGLLIGAAKLYRKISKPLPTPKINQLLKKLLEENPPKYVAGRRFKIYYATQTSKKPMALRLFCNRADILSDAYKRFLEKSIRENFNLGGLSLKLELVGKTQKTADERLEAKSIAAKKRGEKKPVKKQKKQKPEKKGVDPRRKNSLKKLIAKKDAMRQKIKSVKTAKKKKIL